jgi:beta-xylosidase
VEKSERPFSTFVKEVNMKINFVKEPPHPESNYGACTTPSSSAKAISPLFDFPLKDTSMCIGPDDWYYLTGTVVPSENISENDGIIVWKSCDLETWKSIGEVWKFEGSCNSKDEANKFGNASEVNRQIGSPEIHFIKNTFWIAYHISCGGTGLLKSISGLPEGPYEDIGSITQTGKDASIFEDVDGKVYWIYGDGKIARMNDDMTGLLEEPRVVEAEVWRKGDFRYGKADTRIGTHGAFLTKIDGLYFMFCAEEFYRMGSKSVDTFAAVSGNIYGPYSRRYMVLPHGGQTTVCVDKNNYIFATFSGNGQYSALQDRPAIVKLEKVDEGFIRPISEIIFENSPAAQLQPVGGIEIRDPQITLGPDGCYYLTGTSNKPNNSFWAPNDGIHLWSSEDLSNWKHIGLVWDVRMEGTWQNAIRENFAIWAPEIHFTKGTYWITYSMQGESTGLLKSASGKAEGPYIDMGRMTNRDIDSSLFTDDDGAVYYVWQDGKIARMREDMSGFAEEPRQMLTVGGETVGYEGAFIIKKDGIYILSAAEWNGDYRIDGTYDLMYAISENIYGPYSSRTVALPHGGHGTMFLDRDGNLMCTLFGNDRTAPFRTGLGIVKLNLHI